MFMKTLKYKDDDIKGLYKTIANEHPAVNRIVLAYLDKSKKLLITDVCDDMYNGKLTLLKDKETVNISISYLGKVIGVKEENKPYIEIYDNVPRKEMKPIALEYHNNNKSLKKKNLTIYDDDFENSWQYELNDSDHRYNIGVYFIKIPFDESMLINGLLDYPEGITGIRKLLIALSKIIDLKQVSVHLTDYLGSVINIDRGILNQYYEKREINNEYATIVLENDNFYFMKDKNKYKDKDMDKLVKKLGGYDGKEER